MLHTGVVVVAADPVAWFTLLTRMRFFAVPVATTHAHTALVYPRLRTVLPFAHTVDGLDLVQRRAFSFRCIYTRLRCREPLRTLVLHIWRRWRPRGAYGVAVQLLTAATNYAAVGPFYLSKVWFAYRCRTPTLHTPSTLTVTPHLAKARGSPLP